MSREEAVELYLQGRIDRRMFVRALVAAGVTIASATTYAHVLAPEHAGAAAPPQPLGPVLYPPDSLNFVKAWGSQGEGNKRFKGPQGIAVDPDSFNHRVKKLDADLQFVDRDEGDGLGAYFQPQGIAVRGSRLYVCDFGNHRVRKLTA